MIILKTNRSSRTGFTLVEMMTVILIIGLLMAVAVPAIMRTITTGRETAIRMEINALSQAVEQYMQKYGDYPPDGSDWDVLVRHMRRAFPRMSSQDLSLLTQLTRQRGTETFSYVAMDRAEALVFFLGGFSGDPQHPLTGEGGPLSHFSGPVTDLSSYQYNATRDNRFFDFDPARLTIARATDTSPLMSTDETLLEVSDAVHGFADPLPAYLARSGEPTPLVYFDSRTYGELAPGVYNGYQAGAYPSQYGGVRPYKTQAVVQPPSGSSYGSVANALQGIPFHNRETFQIISPGLDGVFGAIVSNSPGSTAGSGVLPVYFVTETGQAMVPNPAASSPSGLIMTSPTSINRYQDVDWIPQITVNGHLDNVTNFSTSTLESDLQ
jgi:prepilin-type N-terminal cleavage/methylation domain-containing protein